MYSRLFFFTFNETGIDSVLYACPNSSNTFQELFFTVDSLTNIHLNLPFLENEILHSYFSQLKIH